MFPDRFFMRGVATARLCTCGAGITGPISVAVSTTFSKSTPSLPSPPEHRHCCDEDVVKYRATITMTRDSFSMCIPVVHAGVCDQMLYAWLRVAAQYWYTVQY